MITYTSRRLVPTMRGIEQPYEAMHKSGSQYIGAGVFTPTFSRKQELIARDVGVAYAKYAPRTKWVPDERLAAPHQSNRLSDMLGLETPDPTAQQPDLFNILSNMPPKALEKVKPHHALKAGLSALQAINEGISTQTAQQQQGIANIQAQVQGNIQGQQQQQQGQQQGAYTRDNNLPEIKLGMVGIAFNQKFKSADLDPARKYATALFDFLIKNEQNVRNNNIYYDTMDFEKYVKTLRDFLNKPNSSNLYKTLSNDTIHQFPIVHDEVKVYIEKVANSLGL